LFEVVVKGKERPRIVKTVEMKKTPPYDADGASDGERKEQTRHAYYERRLDRGRQANRHPYHRRWTFCIMPGAIEVGGLDRVTPV
jgi:hypothetical protein